VRTRFAWAWVWVAAGLLAATVPARACDFDAASSSRWSLAAEAGVWWLKTPCGERFYSLGVNILDGGYPDAQGRQDLLQLAGIRPTLGRLGLRDPAAPLDWGFNSAGGWSLRRSSCGCRRSSTSNSGGAPSSTGSTRSRRRPSSG